MISIEIENSLDLHKKRLKIIEEQLTLQVLVSLLVLCSSTKLLDLLRDLVSSLKSENITNYWDFHSIKDILLLRISNSNTTIIALFKLKAHNLLFWLAAPTLGARAYYDCHIHERVDNLWRIHVNREK